MKKNITISVDDWLWKQYIENTGTKNKSALVQELIVLGTEAKKNLPPVSPPQEVIKIEKDDILHFIVEDLRKGIEETKKLEETQCQKQP